VVVPSRADPVGGAVWVDDRASLATVVAELRGAPAYALDTEFHRERTYFARLALVQVAWQDGLALVDPLAVDLRPLAEVFAGSGVAVVHAADQDLEVLELAVGQVPARLFDTQLAAGLVGLSSPSLATLVERYLGLRLEKGDRLTDWLHRPLTADQRRYAAGDVAYLLELADLLRDDLDRRGRLVLAEEECEALLRRRPRHALPEQAWWKLKDARSLTGRARGVAQSVSAWRERTAAEADVPVRFVLSDMALSGVVHRQPTTLPELAALRGLQGRTLPPDRARSLLAAVAAGQRLAEADLALPPADSLDRSLRPAATIASAWLGMRAHELEVDPALLGTRADLYAFLRGDPSRLSTGWRHELVGELLGRVCAGDVAVVLDGRGGLRLEERSGRRVLAPGSSAREA